MTLAQRIGDYSSPTSLGSRFRRRRIGPLLDMIEAISQRRGSCTILDVGGTRKYWNILPAALLREHRVSVLITNLSDGATQARPDEADGVFSYGVADACDLPYPDRSFDIAHSNSVIEHVGDWPDMVSFSREIRRVAKGYFVQTPNFWFFWEPHFAAPFFHFLPESVRIWLMMRRDWGFMPRCASLEEAVRSVRSARLLDAAMFGSLFPDATIERERFLGMTKSLIAVRMTA